MARRDKKPMQFQISEDDFENAYSCVEELLERKDISDELALDALRLFEALFQKLLDSEMYANSTMDISGVNKLGNLNVKIRFEGKLFSLYTDENDSDEDRILKAYDDKLDFSYSSGFNTVSISVSRSSRRTTFVCIVAALCAVVVYTILYFLVDEGGRIHLLDNYVFPLERLYTNAVLMVGAPMTFFSLLKNLTDTYIVSQKNSSARRLQAKTIVTSIVAILLAFAAGYIMSLAFSDLYGIRFTPGSMEADSSFDDAISSIMPSSIFEPFETLSPIPLIAVSLLVAYALCSTGKHFETLRRAMEACYALFSRMLRIVIAALPVFCFIALMDVLLDAGFESLLLILVYVVLVCAGLLLLFASYAVRLRTRGIAVIPFVRKLAPLIHENMRIGSVLDATPYNIRYCSRAFKMNREALGQDLPVLAQINLDGNCFIIMLTTLMFVFVMGIEASWVEFTVLPLLVLFLSFGAPNQPGSILLGTLIIIAFLKSYEMLCVAICAEAFLGSILNTVNVVGDIVMAAIEERDVAQDAR